MKQQLLNAKQSFRYACLIVLATLLTGLTLRAQTVVNMGSVPSVNSRTGTFYDNGGPSANYSDNLDQSLLISVPGADSIRISFTAFATEQDWDYMQIYQGTNTSGVVLSPITGGAGSSGFGPGLHGIVAPFTYVAAGSSMYIRFRSDGFVNDAGWAATWSAVFPPSYNNIGAISIDTPITPCAGTYPVHATISNFGMNQVTTATVYWSVNNSIQTPYSFSGLLDTINGANPSTARLNLGNYAFNVGVANQVKVWTSMPNGSFDTVPSNDSSSRTIIAAMNGTYTIGGATGPNNFATFGAAVNALQTSGLCGPVVFQVAPGTYNEQVTLTGPILGSSAINTITFDGVDKTTRILNFASTNAAAPHTFGIVNCPNVRVRNLTIRANGNAAGNYGYAVHIRGSGNNNIHVKNCHIEIVGADAAISTSTNYIGVCISGGQYYYNNTKADNIEIDSNYINNGYFSICFYGTTSAPFSSNMQFRNNTMENAYYYGMYLYYLGNPQIINNTIILRPSASTASYGIWIYYNSPSGSETINVTGNRIPRFGGYGIYFGYTSNPVGTKGLVANNMIGGQQLNANGYGMYFISANRWMVYHNSVNMNMAGTTSNIYAGVNVQTSCAGISLINNNLARTASGMGVPLYGGLATCFDTMDYNNFFKVDTTGLVFIGASYNPSNFRGVGGHNTNSLNNNPNFTSATNLNITSGCNNGTALPLVTTDINGATRNTPPDMGADEFPSSNNDIGIQALLSPAGQITPGTQDLIVRIVNSGANTITAANISYVHNGGTPVTQAWTGSLAPCDTISVIFTGSQQITLGNSNSITLYTSAPNGNADANPVNDTLRAGFYTPLNGTYTIGGSGANFPSFAEATSVLNSAGVSGPVHFRVNPGTYNEFVRLNGAINGLSATTPILFEGVNKATTIITENASSTALVMISNLKYISFRNLTMINTTTAGTVFAVIGTTSNFNGTGCNITNCDLSLPNTTTSTSYNILYTSTTSGYGLATQRIDSISIDSNTMTKGYYGIAFYGVGSSLYNRNIIINNNRADNIYYYGAYVRGINNPTDFIGNTINMNPTVGYYGVYFYSNQTANTTIRTRFNNNKISNFGGYGAYIYLPQASSTAAPFECYNNMLNSGSTYNGPNYGLFVQLQSNATAYILHNTSKSNYPVTIANYAPFYYTGSVNGVIRNNIFGVTASTIAPAAYFATSPAAGNVNTNDYYNTAGTNLVYRNGINYDASTYRVAAAGGDSSFNVISAFASTTDLHTINACSPRGVDVSMHLTTDIDGDIRSTSPMVGADELVSISNDMEVVSILAPSVPVSLGAQDVRVLVRNAGGNTVSSFNLVYRHNNGTPVSIAYAGAGMAPCDTLTMVFTGTNQITLGAGNNALKVYTSSPNSVTDANRTNDTVSGNYAAPLNGSYVVGNAPSDFTTVNEAVSAITQRGIVGPVVFNLKSGVFNESVILPVINGMSSTNTVTIQSQANHKDSAEIAWNSATGNLFAIRLNGSYYNLKNLTIRQQNGAITCYALMLQGSPSYDTVNNCRIICPNYNTVGTGSTYTIYATNLAGSGVTVRNSVLSGSFFGVNITGDATQRVRYLTFDNNTFDNIFYASVYQLYYTRFLKFTNNNITAALPVSNTGNYMYWYYNDTNTVISNNRFNYGASITTYWYNYYSMNSTTLPSIFSNNVISSEGTFYLYMGQSTTSNRYVLHNSLNLGGGQLYIQNSGLNNFRVFNNIIQSNNTYAYYSTAAPASPAMASDNNLIFSNTSGTPIYFGAGRSLTAHKTTYPLFEKNSLSMRAPFTSGTDLTPNPADTNVWIINGRGTFLTDVTSDVNNNARPTSPVNGAPDLGAFEVTPNNGVLAPMAIASPVSPAAGTTQTFVLGFDTVATIVWDAFSPVPTDIALRYYTGATANIQGASGKAANAYMNISSNGGGGYLYTLNQYYKETLGGPITSETALRSAHKIGSSWVSNTSTLSTPDSVRNILTTPGMTAGNVIFTGTDDADPIATFLTINSQPVSVSRCSGDSAWFIVDATGTNITYQWQVNTGSGFNNVVSSSATNDTLTVSGITAGMNGYQYRCVIGSASGSANSNLATLTVNPNAAITSHPSNVAICSGANASFSVSATGNGLTYQWQENTGSGFMNIAGATAATLGRSAVTVGMHNYQYRCVVTGNCGTVTSNAATLSVTSVLTINSQPVSTITTCAGTNVRFVIGASGVSTYQWQVSTGTGYTNIPGANDDTLNIASQASMNGNLYRCALTGGCGIAVSNAGQLFVEFPGQWKGTTSSSWTATANWGCGQLPTGASNVVIAATAPNMPVITTNQSVNDLTIETGASITLNTTSARLAIGGAFTNNGTLTNTGGVLSLNGTSQQSITGGTFAKLEINNASGVVLNSDITFTDTLTLASGKVTLGNNKLTLTNTGAIVGYNSSRYIVTNGSGKLHIQNIGTGGRTGAVVFPVGPDVTNYNPVSLTNTGTVDEFSVNAYNGVYRNFTGSTPSGAPVTSNVVGTTWNIEEANAGGSNATVVLQWNGSQELSGFSRGSSYVSHYDGSVWNASAPSAAAGTNPYTLSRTGLTSFSPFAIGSNGTLPVELNMFTADASGASAVINWSTASEVNNDYFIVERSTDNKQFIPIATIKGAGTTTAVNQYNYIDSEAMIAAGLGRKVYYRLSQVDRDGATHTSASLVVEFRGTMAGVNVQPNPFDDKVVVQFGNKALNTIKVADVTGKILLEKTGTTQIEIDELKHLSSGIYFIFVNNGEEIIKVMKK